jgi:hypothetical protein
LKTDLFRMSKQLESRRTNLESTYSSKTKKRAMFATTTMCMLARFRGIGAFGVRRPSLVLPVSSFATSTNKENLLIIPRRTFQSVTTAASLSTEVTTASSSSSSSESSVRPYDEENIALGLGTYTPSDFESKIYQWWEASGCFLPDAKATPSDGNKSKKPPYVLPMPPPNVTGRLHMGHAIFVALQDILARFHRMRGRPVLWLPGAV